MRGGPGLLPPASEPITPNKTHNTNTGGVAGGGGSKKMLRALLRGAQRSHDTDELLRYGRNSPYVHSLLMTFTSHSGSRVGVVHCGVHLLRPLINCMHVYALRLGRETAYLAVSPGAHPTHQPCLGFSLKRHKNPALTRMNFDSYSTRPVLLVFIIQ